MAEALLARLDADRPVKVVPEFHPGFAQGAGGRVVWGDQTVGFLGRIDRSVADKLSLRDVPAAAELRLAPLLSGSRPVPQLHPLPRFPAVRRDVSLIVPDHLRYEKIDSLIRGLNLEFLESIDFVTTYCGKPLESGCKSVTITLVFRCPDATLTSERVEASVQRAIESAKRQLGRSCEPEKRQSGENWRSRRPDDANSVLSALPVEKPPGSDYNQGRQQSVLRLGIRENVDGCFRHF